MILELVSPLPDQIMGRLDPLLPRVVRAVWTNMGLLSPRQAAWHLSSAINVKGQRVRKPREISKPWHVLFANLSSPSPFSQRQ